MLDWHLISRNEKRLIDLNYHLGQTCYKRTEQEVDWDEARRQCWLWGGELAFPLPNQHCTVVSYATQTEEVITNLRFLIPGIIININ